MSTSDPNPPSSGGTGGDGARKGSSPLTLDPVMAKLEFFQLFETASMMYLVGSDRHESQYRILRLNKRLPVTSRTKLADVVREEHNVYSKEELRSTLALVDAGNKETGGLRQTARGYGVVGFVRFVDCFYLVLITQRRQVGSIGGNAIYAIKATEMFPIKDATAEAQEKRSSLSQIWSLVNSKLNPTLKETAESRYVGLFQLVDLSKDFFFSYSYDLTQHLQHNMLASTAHTFPPPPCKDMFKWNAYLTQGLEPCVSTLTSCFWILPIIHGAYIQRRCSRFGRITSIILLARRSRHFAGTRYLKRGVSDCGKVANDVEVEQIVHEENGGGGVFSSFVQMRGSIPTYWSQESSMTSPKPPIILNRVDPSYVATQLHFADLLERYSSPLCVLNLIKQKEKREREVIVGKDFKSAIDCLNGSMPMEHRIRYCALDFSSISKIKGPALLRALEDVARWGLDQTGFFCSDLGNAVGATTTPPLSGERRNSMSGEGNPRGAATAEGGAGPSVLEHLPWRGGMRSEQRGVLRTNCIDSLDRTNVAQFMVGMFVLHKQLAAVGMSSGHSGGTLLLDGQQSPVVSVFMEMFTQLGDTLALQYGGSETNKRVATEADQAGGAALNYKHKELLTTMRRYCSNAFTDAPKQDAMNLFLGLFVPWEQEVALWELESDYYLHNTRVRLGGVAAMHAYAMQMREWRHQDEEDEDEEEEEEEDMAMAGLSLTTPDGSSSPGKKRALTPNPTSPPKEVRDPLDPLEEAARKEDERRRGLQLKRQRVRRRCAAQMGALSSWWVEALQHYDQQRMWMQLGPPPSQWKLPSRFERRYAPRELSEFDALLAHDFMHPVNLESEGRRRPTHQHTSSSSSLDHSNTSDDRGEEGKGDKSITITRFARDFSTRAARLILNRLAHKTPSVGSGLEHKAESLCLEGSSLSRQRSGFVGEGFEDLQQDDVAIFQAHLQPLLDPDSVCGHFPPLVDEEVQRGYEQLLTDVLLESDDVEALHTLAIQLDAGPYRGLEQDVLVNPLLSYQVWLQDRFEADLPAIDPTRVMHTHDWRRKEAELRQCGLYSEGLESLFRDTLHEAKDRREWYGKALDPEAMAALHSAYCDDSSRQLYRRFFDPPSSPPPPAPLPSPPPPPTPSSTTPSTLDSHSLLDPARFLSNSTLASSDDDGSRHLPSLYPSQPEAVTWAMEVEPSTSYFPDMVQVKSEDYYRKDCPFFRLNKAGAIGARCLPDRVIASQVAR